MLHIDPKTNEKTFRTVDRISVVQITKQYIVLKKKILWSKIYKSLLNTK